MDSTTSSLVGHYLTYTCLFLPCLPSSDLYCENGPPTDIADRLNASFPFLMGMGLGQRSTARISELDRFVKLVFGL